ncbi:MAG: threonine-phosphate decarboxylase CobD [Candidatus Omnitrophota bacterium]
MGSINFSHGGNIYAIKEKYGKKVIDFSASINPLGLPQSTENILSRIPEAITHYPDPEAKKLTSAVARYLKINEENILVGNGSIELIYLIAQAIQPKTTLILTPSFSEYERASRCLKSKITFVNLNPEKGFLWDVRDFKGCSDLLFLCNPNNPTGNLTLTDPAAIKNFPAKLTVIDESFMDFLEDEKKYTFLRQAIASQKIIVLRTFTKFFALAGLRIGYLVAHKNVIRKLKAYQIPWSVNVFAQSAAEAALSDKKYMKKTRALIEKEREFIFTGLSAIKGLAPYPSVANFILVKIKNNLMNAAGLRQKLIQKGILIRDCANFRGLNNKYFRVAIRLRADNLRLLKALQEIFEQN